MGTNTYVKNQKGEICSSTSNDDFRNWIISLIYFWCLQWKMGSFVLLLCPSWVL